eukprot:CAMPEP_0113299414 /NCGR_PEP_ID=MMETSP0010_2-20120614/1462_1 /TAXON_ID=216773 ORGANISM="Corethron hystrix, Strain 308" /NCGR_SAMPLE_ID=MMETSP0010_2 /ASSEMBLY_ACC=CAM_ASM_000155 /LENGTH=76 /DNA_ID=CAMNT_0000152651 /DNA_START=288 /DNA_END=518 /DNA_ORIENTATION=- /assembly_acc=CAM_ASM_000155
MSHLQEAPTQVRVTSVPLRMAKKVQSPSTTDVDTDVAAPGAPPGLVGRNWRKTLEEVTVLADILRTSTCLSPGLLL